MMKSTNFRWKAVPILAGVYVMLSPALRTKGDEFLSNLNEASPGMVRASPSPQSPSLYGGFITGDALFSLNSIRLEFAIQPLYSPEPWKQVEIQVWSTNGIAYRPVQLANATLSPERTTFSQEANPSLYTKYVDFYPASSLSLEPFTEYTVEAKYTFGSVTNNHYPEILITSSTNYTTQTDWRLGAPVFGHNAGGKADAYMKVAVDATQIPEPSAAWVALACAALAARARRKGIRS